MDIGPIDLKEGDLVTVKWHYGYTDSDKVMTVLYVQQFPGYRSGYKIGVDGLDYGVDYGLINKVKDSFRSASILFK